jgi:D-alanine--poly(phosphoribitol) ligase subunit 1
MELLKRLKIYSESKADVVAFKNAFTDEIITYSQLWSYSDDIASKISSTIDYDKSPIVVYGHKSPLMLATFLACVKTGHPYCPVDISMPTERLKDIVEASSTQLLIALEDTEVSADNKWTMLDIKGLPDVAFTDEHYVSGNDVYYIIFTSGSTGKPKGVMITADCLDNYLYWMESIMTRSTDKEHLTFLNQAPFSFDLSVMDTYTSLFMGGTIWSMEKRLQEDMGFMHAKLKKSGLNAWVSTPSFMNVCLLNKEFNQDNLPEMTTFLFCGEVLTNKTARELQKRFPKAEVINTYGPTESTVAVTEVVITDEMAG